MAETVGDALVARLEEWGVRRIYGYPGDGINGILGSLRRAEERVRFIQTRHEELAAFMACAHAKFTGEVGVCLATSGPGAIHLLNGLYDAKMDSQGVLAIVGQQARTALGSFYQQEVDLPTLFKDVAEYVVQLAVPAQLHHCVDTAMRLAQARHAVTCLIVPNDLQTEEAAEPPRAHGSTFSGAGYAAPRVVPTDDQLRQAAAVLNAGERVAMLVGAGALAATDEVLEVAEAMGAGIAKALLGKAVVPDDLPFVTGAIGLLGTRPSWDLMMNCDTLLVGARASRTRSSCPSPARRAGCRSTSIPARSAFAIRWRWRCTATPPSRCARCVRCSRARRTGPGGRRRRRTSASGGRCSRRGP
jgi:pyruvate dehydrogenase (quinone)